MGLLLHWTYINRILIWNKPGQMTFTQMETNTLLLSVLSVQIQKKNILISFSPKVLLSPKKGTLWYCVYEHKGWEASQFIYIYSWKAVSIRNKTDSHVLVRMYSVNWKLTHMVKILVRRISGNHHCSITGYSNNFPTVHFLLEYEFCQF